jgi:hypothetical protein
LFSTAAADEILNRPQQAFLSFQRALWGKGIGLIEDQVEGCSVLVVEPLGKVGHEAGLLTLAKV